jgi:thioredoxin-related protein
MAKNLGLFLLTLVFLVSLAKADIRWLKDLDLALYKAKKQNKLVLVYIYSPHCGYCKRMDRTTFRDKEIQEYVEKYFIPVKIDSNSPEGEMIKTEYGYLGTPTFHFIEPDGKKIKSIFGAWEKKDFLMILKYFAEGHYKKMTMTEYFMEEN